jgi:DNA-binding NarL/FixJ family response regulator
MDSAKNYDLVISDLGLPDGTGYDLMAKMRAIRPHQKVLYVCIAAKSSQSFAGHAAGHRAQRIRNEG